ncbi:MAG: FAD binding domain-containing protein [Coriobacteriales bacterium]|jgi:carbon-monoxide dehydrogenase small subunit/xanthine dehydrogenase small subunit|nr:FAD binding domain-containing protein [Coriobacteriales bacterium]
MKTTVTFLLNGETVTWRGDPGMKLLDLLRDELGMTEVKCGCREGECGACSVLLDGVLVNSCLVAAGRVDACAVTTLAGLRTTARFAALDKAFARHSAVQCGYCIPGMILAAEALLVRTPQPSEAEIRVAISGNLCRCTGYNAIVAAIREAAEELAGAAAAGAGADAVAGDAARDVVGAAVGAAVGDVASVAPVAPAAAPGAAALCPTALPEALELLAAKNLVPCAGGTDLLAHEYAPPAPEGSELLFVHRIGELKALRWEGDVLRIGAGLTYGELLDRSQIPEILRTAIASIAAPAVRNAGTIGGNLANASPKGDAALACFVTDCTLRLVSVHGERLVPIGAFYQGRGRTVRRPDELLVEILMPTRWTQEGRWTFEKVGGRKALAISRVSFAGLVAFDIDASPHDTDASPHGTANTEPTITHLATAFGAVADVVVRRPEIDAMLIGCALTEAQTRIPEWLATWEAALQPVRGRVSAEYRKQVCLNLARAFIERSLS